MVFWRISRYHDLTGAGGLRASGRWHSAGQPVVYLSESPAGALLEVCVHTAAGDVPPRFTLLRIEGTRLAIDVIPPGELTPGWQSDLALSRELGTRWLQAGGASLLRVPSAIVPHTSNFLLNPLHPGAGKLRIAESLEYPFDSRIKG